MEISAFLQQSATWNLRKSYLESVRQKHSGIIEFLKVLLNPNAPNSEKKNTVSSLFNEVHRLKGSGGTYGFNEISWIYKDLIAFIRPAHEGKHPLDLLDAQKALETADEFSKYLPLFSAAFLNTNPSVPPFSSSSPASILLVSEERPPFVAALERLFVRKTCVLFTTPSRPEALEALKILKPAGVIVNVNLPGIGGVDFLKELKQHEGLNDSSFALLLKEASDKSKKDVMEAGASHLFSMDAPGEILLKEIEFWITKSL